MQDVSLKKIILNAYGIPDDREYALAGPDWLTIEHFDIDATYAPNTSVEQMRQMLQAMLADRFKLALHRETRQLPIYALVVAKGGPRIHAVEDGPPKTSGKPGQFEATRITMRHLADLLARQEGLPVLDQTGLQGVFSFTLEWAPEETTGNASSGPSLFAALQDQLGLKLEGRKGPAEVLVVDHIERTPREN